MSRDERTGSFGAFALRKRRACVDILQSNDSCDQCKKTGLRDPDSDLVLVHRQQLLDRWRARLAMFDSGLLGSLLGVTAERIAKDRSIFGPVLGTFVFSEVLKQTSWLDENCALYHYRDKDQGEVDLVIEVGSGALVGVEVKASATVNTGDFEGLRKLADAAGDKFKLGVVLYDGGKLVPFGYRLLAAPVSCLWE